jgi:hypothetical protein
MFPGEFNKGHFMERDANFVLNVRARWRLPINVDGIEVSLPGHQNVGADFRCDGGSGWKFGFRLVSGGGRQAKQCYQGKD